MKPTILDAIANLTKQIATRRASLALSMREMESRTARIATALECGEVSDPEQAVAAIAGDMAMLAREGAAIYANEQLIKAIARAAC